MPRLAVTLSCILVAAGLSSAASAAGRGGGPGLPAVPMAGPRLHGAPPIRAARPWHMSGQHAQGRHHRRAPSLAFGDPWPWYGPGVPTGGVTIVERQAEAPPIDPYSFENLRPRTGIRPAPTPEPAIYRLEGPRDRPVTRVIPIVSSEAAQPAGRELASRSRVAHAETGALLLTVPSR